MSEDQKDSASTESNSSTEAAQSSAPSEAAEGELVTQDDSKPVAAVVAAEIDPHGATIVAVVGDEDGVQAVVAVETNYFNTVLAAEFANPDAAKAAYLALLDAEIKGTLRIDGVLAVHADEAGKIHIDRLTEHSTKTGVKWGAAAGLALGVLFPPAIIASTVGWGIVGGALGKLRNLHHRHQVADQLAGAIGPNNSGILALIHATDVAKVKEHIPEATKVTTAEVDEAAAKDITDAAKQAGDQPSSS